MVTFLNFNLFQFIFSYLFIFFPSIRLFFFFSFFFFLLFFLLHTRIPTSPLYLHFCFSFSISWSTSISRCLSFSLGLKTLKHTIHLLITQRGNHLCAPPRETKIVFVLCPLSPYILWVRFFFIFYFLSCYGFISFMRKNVFCDQIAFCISFILCFGVFVAVEVEINAKILIYCAKFFIWIYSSVHYFK